MPVSGEESVEKSALYPDELPGSVLRIDPERATDGELFWDAGDDDDLADLPDDGSTQYGLWLPVEHPAQGETWAAAPRALREQVVRLGLGPGDCFEVTDVMRGEAEHDPYELAVHEAEPDGRPA